MHYSSESANKNEIQQFFLRGGRITGVEESTFIFKMTKLSRHYFIEVLLALQQLFENSGRAKFRGFCRGYSLGTMGTFFTSAASSVGQWLWWVPWSVQVTWVHSRGVFCCRKKRNRLISSFPTQVPAPHLSHLCALDPLWIKTSSSWDEAKDRELQKAKFLPVTLQQRHKPGDSSFIPTLL